MRPWYQPWGERLGWWVPALVLVLINLGLLTTHRVVLRGALGALESNLAEQRSRHQEAATRRSEREALLTAATTARADVRTLYRDHLGTEEERLTRILAEVKQLARDASLLPETISYPEVEFEDYGLVKIAFVFGVEGTYHQLRSFIGALEGSSSFLSLDSITVREGNQPHRLRIDLRLSTVFVEDEAAASTAAGRREG